MEFGSCSTGDSTTNEVEGCADLFIPYCDAKEKPFEGQIFCNLQEAEKFYEDYAKVCGFIPRKATINRDDDGSISTRFMLCNREGAPNHADSLILVEGNREDKKRKRTSFKIGCRARIIFKAMSYDRFRVGTFSEGHNHKMVTESSRHFMSSNRQVDEVHQFFIHAGIKANIGPTKTFRIFKEIVGGYDKVGCTSIDFKNYGRDLKVYVAGSDAHMLLETFKDRKELCDGFQYFYDVDEEKQLRRLIWTDKQAVINFKNFGQAVSFDATYNTNRYKMIFTPFTGRDNHGKCVSFGAAIISHEDMDSYAWVLSKFTECVGNAPRVFMTDQDPGLKKAVALVWPETHHRFCMWHITMKVVEKLPFNLRDDSEFKSKLNNIIWSDTIDTHEFEEEWNNLIAEYELGDNRWFSSMYEDRALWIPAYFRDISMSGLFRTTSLSESENSYFKRFLSKFSDLVVLFMNYNSALDAQRDTCQRLNYEDETGVLPILTTMAIEKHASTLYTISIFKEVQEEIVSAFQACMMAKMEGNTFVVDDNVDGEFTVVHDTITDSLTCKCNLFTRKGLLCRHMFYVLRWLKVEKIPDRYIANRWCKSFMLSTPQVMNCTTDSSSTKVVGKHDLFHVFSRCIGHVSGDQVLMKQLLGALSEVENKFGKLRNENATLNSKDAIFQEFYGSVRPEVPTVLSPAFVKTKGSGVGGRRKSGKEKAMILAQKPLRNCKRCNTMGHHDSRNCPTKAVVKP
ncbi:protein FAR1-RELATED SEQUENCE 5-like [Salvia miltiorrhiza]|uniref:protein FAR1-RELATED SEQUENCE 5-like n=1 Tax=Salvia miltiorrhiza TaxID=226208 RepID=UPI0025AD8ACE|nr:protein FAR1-RELATED SEQUENCE 5-like [Salvia miltiorrhiza]